MEQNHRSDRSALRDAMCTYVPENEKQISADAYAERLRVCESCTERFWTECKLLQRSILSKARRKDFHCPIGKWGGSATVHKPTSAVVITCHNYGNYLRESIGSVLSQTEQPVEIVVVDDASTDDTRQIASEFAAEGVRYQRIDARNVLAARKKGLECTTAEIVCFLDADDLLAADYLERGLPLFGDSGVGVVYSDIQRFEGEDRFLVMPDEVDRVELAHRSYMHAGSLVRREALAMTNALEREPKGMVSEWFVWRRVMESGWKARKQSATYRYRRHRESMSHVRGETSFYQRAALEHETVTIAVPLWGRGWAWPRFVRWLDDEQWPKEQTRLILFDLSGKQAFSNVVRRGIAELEFSDLRYARSGTAEPRLRIDRPSSVAAMYNQLAREVNTDYVLLVDDDVLPPRNVCEQLLRGFTARTACVSAVCPSGTHDRYSVWDWLPASRTVQRQEAGVGYEKVGGCRFRCVMLRKSVINDFVFSVPPVASEATMTFHERLWQSRWEVLVDWNSRCERLERI